MKKIFAILFILICMTVLSGMAFGIEPTPGLNLERITNPQATPGEPDGIKPWENDSSAHFRGDRWNSYIWSMTCFTPKNECCEEQGTELWVGTNRNLLYSAFLGLYIEYLQEDFTIEEFDYVINKLFCGNVPTGYHLGDCIDKDFRAQIWKWPLCDGPWELVYQSDFSDYDCCGAGWNDGDWLNDEHPLCCTRKWKFGPDWGYREAGAYTPSCGADCCPSQTEEVCCSWPRVVFGNSRSFLNPDIPDVERLRTIAFGLPGTGDSPEQVICDEDFTVTPFGGLVGDNVSFRVVTTYKADACVEPGEECEACSYDHLIMGSETAIYATCDMENYYKIWELGNLPSSPGFGIIFEALQYRNYLYVTLGGQNGFQLIRGKPGNVCANPYTLSKSCDCCEIPYCPWDWEVLVGCDSQGNLLGNAVYPDGMGRESYMTASLAVCDDCLYIGSFTVWFIEEMLEFLEGWNGEEVITNTRARLSAQSENDMAASLLQNDNTAPASLTSVDFSFLLDFIGTFTSDLLSLAMDYDMKCGTQVYRYCAGGCGEEDRWDLVAGAPIPAFPEGSISNIRGDGWAETAETSNKFNAYTWRMICCNDKLYATTFDVRAAMSALTECWCVEEGPFAQLIDCMDIDLAEKLCCVLNVIRTDMEEKAHGNPYGFDMYRLENPEASSGLQWTMITQDGFGDKYNYGGRTLECCECDGQDCIFVGTANPFWGGQVWKICPECIPEDVVESGSFCPCGTWELTLTPCECGEVSGDILLTSNPERFLEGDSNIYFQIATTGEVCGIELCVDFSDCSTCSGYDALAHWDGSQWNDLGDPSGGELCVNVTAFPDDVFAVGTGFAFPGDDDDDNGTPGDDDDDASGTPGPSTGGSGCNVGTGAAVLLILLPLGILYFRKF